MVVESNNQLHIPQNCHFYFPLSVAQTVCKSTPPSPPAHHSSLNECLSDVMPQCTRGGEIETREERSQWWVDCLATCHWGQPALNPAGGCGLTGCTISELSRGGIWELWSFSLIPVSHWLRAAPREGMNFWACTSRPVWGQSRFWSQRRLSGQGLQVLLVGSWVGFPRHGYHQGDKNEERAFSVMVRFFATWFNASQLTVWVLLSSFTLFRASSGIISILPHLKILSFYTSA